MLLNISDLPRGIDNYHIDVKLSPKFCAAFKKLLADYLALETSEKPQRLKNDKQVEEFRNCYIDMVTVLINRVKTDLSPEQINFLQFAIYRFMLENTKNALDNHIKAYRDKLSELRTSGSGKALGHSGTPVLAQKTLHHDSLCHLQAFLRTIKTDRNQKPASSQKAISWGERQYFSRDTFQPNASERQPGFRKLPD